MAVTLPYPTINDVGEFTPLTVHSDTAHNAPHSNLLANDQALKAAVDNLESSYGSLSIVHSIVRITPVISYLANDTTFGTETGFPSEWPLTTTHNTSHAGSYQTISYPASISSNASNILVQIAIFTKSSSQCHVHTKAPNVPEFVAAFSYSRNNSDDSGSDTSIIELPYYTGRYLQVRLRVTGHYGFIVTFMGYRSKT